MPLSCAAVVHTLGLITRLVFHVDAWIEASLLAVLLAAAWVVGFRIGRRRRDRGDRTGMGKVGEATLTLMALLLGFSFAVSLQKHDARRLAIVADSNAIGDFYTAASMLKEPVRSQLHDVIRDYAKHRFDLVEAHTSEAELQAALKEVAAMQNRMTELVRQALDAGDTATATPIVTTLNGVTSMHASRLSTYRDVLPGSVVVLLFVASIAAIALLGLHDGTEPMGHLKSDAIFIVLIVCCVYVTLDLNQAHRGMIQVSQEPMVKLIESMGP
jgi:hypothetical protein